MRKEDIQRFNKILEQLQGKKEQGKYEYMALCPAHGDARLSLWIKLQENGKIHLDCKAGCSINAIVESLGFTLSVLYPSPQIIDIFDYITIDGDLLYQEIKYDTTSLNRFKVRRPSKKPGEYVWSKDGLTLILYNLFEVQSAKDDEIIFMCEGAKDARTVLNKGLIGTACLFNDWVKVDSRPLDNHDVIILVDNDGGGETKALKAAHDRYGHSRSVKMIRFPELKVGGDVTDWFEAGGTKEKLLELAGKAEDWFPQQSVRQRIKDQQMTGMSFEHSFPRPIFLEYLEIFHPPEEGPMNFYDDEWLKGQPQTKLFIPISKNSILEEITQLLLFCCNKNSKNSDEEFKPTPKLKEMVLKSGETFCDLNVIENPSLPIFNPFFMVEKEKNYKPEDIVILKDYNFYVPERCPFPRNMESCIAKHALPFNYDEKAKCPEIDKAFNIQWRDDSESTDLLLQFLFYTMKRTHIYKAILFMVGESDCGKSEILNLIRQFIGPNSCEAISLSKIGNQFELWRCRDAQLLISDDVVIEPRDLLGGALKENLKSIPAGGAIRLEKKGGIIVSRILPGQLLMAGNYPPSIPEISRALSKRFFFLNFPHVFIKGGDMIIGILEIWIDELTGLLNRVLDAGPNLIKNDGFIEPMTSAIQREKFEGGANPLREFIIDMFDISAPDCVDPWITTVKNMQYYYDSWCTEQRDQPLTRQKFNKFLEAISGIRGRKTKKVRIINKDGKEMTEPAKVWIGLRRKGMKNKENIGNTTENAVEF